MKELIQDFGWRFKNRCFWIEPNGPQWAYSRYVRTKELWFCGLPTVSRAFALHYHELGLLYVGYFLRILKFEPSKCSSHTNAKAVVHVVFKNLNDRRDSRPSNYVTLGLLVRGWSSSLRELISDLAKTGEVGCSLIDNPDDLATLK